MDAVAEKTVLKRAIKSGQIPTARKPFAIFTAKNWVKGQSSFAKIAEMWRASSQEAKADCQLQSMAEFAAQRLKVAQAGLKVRGRGYSGLRKRFRLNSKKPYRDLYCKPEEPELPLCSEPKPKAEHQAQAMTVLGGEFLTKIGPMLGRGSYGEVVPGFHVKTGVPVAVKAFSSCSKDVMIKDGLAGFTLCAWLLLVPTFRQRVYQQQYQHKSNECQCQAPSALKQQIGLANGL